MKFLIALGVLLIAATPGAAQTPHLPASPIVLFAGPLPGEPTDGLALKRVIAVDAPSRLTSVPAPEGLEPVLYVIEPGPGMTWLTVELAAGKELRRETWLIDPRVTGSDAVTQILTPTRILLAGYGIKRTRPDAAPAH
jgi:hypothetical protein